MKCYDTKIAKVCLRFGSGHEYVLWMLYEQDSENMQQNLCLLFDIRNSKRTRVCLYLTRYVHASQLWKDKATIQKRKGFFLKNRSYNMSWVNP